MPVVAVEFAAGGGTRHTPTRSTVRRSKVRPFEPARRPAAPATGFLISAARPCCGGSCTRSGEDLIETLGSFLCRLHQAGTSPAANRSFIEAAEMKGRTHGANSSTRRP